MVDLETEECVVVNGEIGAAIKAVTATVKNCSNAGRLLDRLVHVEGAGLLGAMDDATITAAEPIDELGLSHMTIRELAALIGAATAHLQHLVGED